MTLGRFASITSDLLARKGEARPWAEQADPPMNHAAKYQAAKPPLEKQPLIWRTPTPPPAVPAPAAALPPVVTTPPVQNSGSRKCSLRMSAHDYERLGIIAVKLDTTRQHLLQQALAQFLVEKEKLYRRDCLCMAAEPCGQACRGR